MRLALLSLIIFMFNVEAKAQNAILEVDTVKKTTVTLAAIYSSNANYYGQTTADKLPYMLGNATIRFPFGLYFSAGSYKLVNVGSGISETDLGIGYEYTLNKMVTVETSYTRSFFAENSPLLQAANENNISLSASWQWNWFKTAISTDYAFGIEDDLFIGISNSKYIELGTLFNDADLISVEPEIEIVSGSQHFFTTYTESKNKRNKANGNGKAHSNGNSGNSNVVTIDAAKTSFNLLSYNFKLPLVYNRASYMVEISYQFSVLGAKAITEARRQQSFVNFGLYYQF